MLKNLSSLWTYNDFINNLQMNTPCLLTSRVSSRMGKFQPYYTQILSW